MPILMVPGIGGSDERHWQSLWEAEWGPSATRIEPSSWATPELEDWCRAIGAAVARVNGDAVLVAHSLGCLAVARWVADHRDQVRGVFLVAPPDRSSPSFPVESAPTFTAVAASPTRIPGLVVSSVNDPYCVPEVAERLAMSWGLPQVSVGAQGHVNSESGLGAWDVGRNLLTAFMAGMS